MNAVLTIAIVPSFKENVGADCNGSENLTLIVFGPIESTDATVGAAVSTNLTDLVVLATTVPSATLTPSTVKSAVCC